jgi:hypothetical protein
MEVSAMKFIVGTMVGLGLGAVVSTLLLASLAGCSCPPGYKPRTITPGTYEIVEDADASVASGTIRFDQTTGLHTYTQDNVVWEVRYRVTGAR